MGTLNPDLLRDLYQTQLLTDTAIGKQFGIAQARVSALRKRWGIPTIGRNDRLQLPPLTATQISLLVGSMLGDGRLMRSGTNTAALVEYHCLEQKDYSEWKASIWGNHFLGLKPIQDGQYQGVLLRTHGCRECFPYWQMFYPNGTGDKEFGALPVDQVDDFALAVWYMDDGSVTDGIFRFAIGPNRDSTRRQMAILRKFGLHPHYGESARGDHAISLSGAGDLERFRNLITPHIPECMSRKLVLPVARKRRIPPREKLTRETLQELADRGFTPAQVAKSFSAGITTVRRLAQANGVGWNTKRGPKQDNPQQAVQDAELLLRHERDPVRAIALLSRLVLPAKTLSHEDQLKDLESLRSCRADYQGGVLSGINSSGIGTCNTLFPYRYAASYRGAPSLLEAWADPVMLEKAIKFQLRVGDPLTPKRVMRALQAITRAPTNFRPAMAKAIIRAYLPEGGLVLDPCAGYGGRACGALSLGCSYVGVEPHPEAPRAYEQLGILFGGSLRLIPKPFEDADLSGIEADLVFTSPPYFMVEHYSPDPNQSWVRYPTWGLWVSGFLEPLVAKSYQALKSGGHLVINTKTVRDGARVYPIDFEVERLAKATGFTQIGRYDLQQGRIGKQAITEPLLVFRKP